MMDPLDDASVARGARELRMRCGSDPEAVNFAQRERDRAPLKSDAFFFWDRVIRQLVHIDRPSKEVLERAATEAAAANRDWFAEHGLVVEDLPERPADAPGSTQGSLF